MPAGTRVYAIGDIHGCAPELDRLLAKIASDAEAFSGEKYLVYLGDYVDRGPDSRGVVERVLNGSPDGFTVQYVKGNHEAALLEFLEDADSYLAWRNFGAPDTLLSYGVRPPLFESPTLLEEARLALAAAMPAAHLGFFRDLQLMVVFGDYAFVHAGIRPGLALDDQSEQDLLWIREEFLNSARTFEKVIVHGHTPLPEPQNLHNRISIDTGTYATGVLSCVVLEGATRRFIQVGPE